MIDLPVACALSDESLRERRGIVQQQLRQHVREIKTLDDGYAFRFAADDESVEALMQLVQVERKCCRFLHFRLSIEPGGDPIWLELTGPEGTKQFLETELGVTC